MQQTQTSNFHNPRLSTSSHSSLSAATSALLNGLLPSHRLSQGSTTAPALAANLTPNQINALQQTNKKLQRIKRLRHFAIVLSLTILLGLLLGTTIEYGCKLVKKQPNENTTKSWNFNSTNSPTIRPIRAFFTCVWIFNGFLFLSCLIVHIYSSQRRSRRTRSITVFFREFGSIYENKSPSSNSIIGFISKTCLLAFLWYSSCYLFLHSMVILIPVEVIVLYSMTITFRQLFGWIFLHEQFIGNKIIAYILAFSAFLFLAHDDGFRFNMYLLALTLVTCGVSLKTIFDIFMNSCIKNLTNTKLRIAMINICFCGTCFFWPFVLILSVTNVEHLEFKHIRWSFTLLTLFCALAYTILTIVISFKYSSTSNSACFLLVIPSTSLIDRYVLNIHYSPLVVSAVICSFAGILLSMIPKKWFLPSETNKMKQALGLLNKDANPTSGPIGTGGTTAGKSSAFDEIRAQRRIRSALLYNEVKT